MELNDFLELSSEEVYEIVQNSESPKLGIFVPDGNRRLMLIESDLKPGTEEYYIQLAEKQLFHGLESLDIFFSHGLPILFTPLFSSNVLNREEPYQRLTARKTLEGIFNSENWLDFYKTRQIQVRTYGNKKALKESPYTGILKLINQVEKSTKKYSKHKLFIGIGDEPWVGWDAANSTIKFLKRKWRFPSSREVLIKFMYGADLPSANFVIFSGKPGGLGALPALISGKNTQLFYLPGPGILALNKKTFRKILHNQIYVKKGGFEVSNEQRIDLKKEYEKIKKDVIGLGQNIGPVWIPSTE